MASLKFDGMIEAATAKTPPLAPSAKSPPRPGRGAGLRPRSHPRQVEGARPRVGLVDGLGQPAPSHLLKGTTAIVLKFASSTLTPARNLPEPVIEQRPRSKKVDGEVPAPQNWFAARLVQVFDASVFPN